MHSPAAVVQRNARGGPLVAPRKGKARPTNGSCTHIGGDPNTPEHRRYRDLLNGLRARDPATIEEIKMRGVATLALQQEIKARRLAEGKSVPTDELTALESELRRSMDWAALAGTANAETEADRLRREQEDREAGLIP